MRFFYVNMKIIIVPIFPYINNTEENISELFKLAKLNNVNHIFGYFRLILRDRQKKYFYKKLDVFFSGFKEKYKKGYGLTYSCRTDNAEKHAKNLKEKTQSKAVL